jgi:hypothetical protein
MKYLQTRRVHRVHECALACSMNPLHTSPCSTEVCLFPGAVRAPQSLARAAGWKTKNAAQCDTTLLPPTHPHPLRLAGGAHAMGFLGAPSQVASIAKVMTFLVASDALEAGAVTLTDAVQVGTEVSGTSASLQVRASRKGLAAPAEVGLWGAQPRRQRA